VAGKSEQPVRNPNVANVKDCQLHKEIVPWDHVNRH